MEAFKNVMVALTGLILIAFTVVLTATLVYFVENPVVLNLECSPDLIQWQGKNYACEVQFVEGVFDQMVLWKKPDVDLLG